MKLVAVWIKKYHRIKEHGFVFDGRYKMTFEYSREKLLVNINFNPDYVDLYGDESSISNVTGIVGVNGSGKSSLINFLYGIFSAQNLGDSFCFVFVEIDSEIQVYQYISHNRHKLVGKWRISEDLESLEVVESIYSQTDFIFDRNSEYSSIEYITFNPILRYENQQLYDKEVGTPNPLNRSSSYLFRQALSPVKLNKYLTMYGNEANDKQFYNPFVLYNFESFKRKVRLLAFFNEFDKNQILTVFKDIHFPEKATIWFQVNDLFESLTPEKNEVLMRYFTEIIGNLNKTSAINRKIVVNIYLWYILSKNISIEELEENLIMLSKHDFTVTETIDILRGIENNEKERLLKLDLLLKSIKVEYSDSDNSPMVANIPLLISYSSSFWHLLEQLLICFPDDFNVGFQFSINAQSSGEEALIALFAELYEALQYSKKDNVIIAIDEGDSFLHPEWQRLYVNNIVTFLDFINKKRGWNKKYQVLLTSHSPFIVSDIPHYNLIKLQKDENGFTKVMNNQDTETLGGNIFRLFQDEFFVDEFISAFAYEKIKEAIFFMDGREQTTFKNNEELLKFIDIIGEPLIRRQLKQKYELGKDKNDEDSIELI